MSLSVRQVLQRVSEGAMSVEDALLHVKEKPFEDLGFAKVDLHRRVRQGATEVVYGAGKTPEQVAGILEAMRRNGQGPILITRLSPETAAAVGRSCALDYHEEARVGIVGDLPKPDGIGRIIVATGGTSDIPVAEEAALKMLYDVRNSTTKVAKSS